ncbi:hypothetical protein OJ253_2481 [Cryptosporidium canis]|uniref:Uncharacterized protein n=1 Tax=Cryptosporidium canis TaxID=195482 RepID=A0A9D5HWQ9_9CRYT|nr:hypothetical protein OJ253_2481 [Cryptosporidium canis]
MDEDLDICETHTEADKVVGELGVEPLDMPLDCLVAEGLDFGCRVERMGHGLGLDGEFRPDVMGVQQGCGEKFGVGVGSGALEGGFVANSGSTGEGKTGLEGTDRTQGLVDQRRRADEWRNELLSFPQLFNQAFLSLYRYNEYIDQRWSVLDESHNRLYNMLLELSRFNSLSELPESRSSESIVIFERNLHKEGGQQRGSDEAVRHLECSKGAVSIYIPGTVVSGDARIQENEYRMRLYEEIFNRFQTCKNDIDITFERKAEMLSELDSKIKMIISSIERFISSNQHLMQSHTKPLYNIDNNDIGEIGIVRRKTGLRGRPPGSGNRGRPPGSTKKAKKIPM